MQESKNTSNTLQILYIYVNEGNSAFYMLGHAEIMLPMLKSHLKENHVMKTDSFIEKITNGLLSSGIPIKTLSFSPSNAILCFENQHLCEIVNELELSLLASSSELNRIN